MANKIAPLLPATDELLHEFGDRLRLARLRRRLSAKQVGERAGMSPMTLRSLERGGSGVTIGAYLAVMQVLGIETDINLLGKSDPMGRELQDARLSSRVQATPQRVLLPTKPAAKADRQIVSGKQPGKLREPSGGAGDWIEKGGFANSEALASLIVPLKLRKKRVR